MSTLSRTWIVRAWLLGAAITVALLAWLALGVRGDDDPSGDEAAAADEARTGAAGATSHREPPALASHGPEERGPAEPPPLPAESPTLPAGPPPPNESPASSNRVAGDLRPVALSGTDLANAKVGEVRSMDQIPADRRDEILAKAVHIDDLPAELRQQLEAAAPKAGSGKGAGTGGGKRAGNGPRNGRGRSEAKVERR